MYGTLKSTSAGWREGVRLSLNHIFHMCGQGKADFDQSPLGNFYSEPFSGYRSYLLKVFYRLRYPHPARTIETLVVFSTFPQSL